MSFWQRFLNWLKPAPYPSQVGPIVPFSEDELIRRHNAERKKAGVPPLRRDQLLTVKAQGRADHAAFEALPPARLHEGFGMIPGATHAGENAAMGQADAASVMDTWMRSPGHRANILNPDFTAMGAGRAISKDMVTYWYVVFSG